MIRVLEESLSVRMQRNWLERWAPGHEQLRSAAEALEEYYSNFSLPQKKPHELRPFVSPSFRTSREVGLGYVFESKHFPTLGDYVFDPSQEGQMTRVVKRLLLYCHGLCIPDPLPYLLDYFRLEPGGKFAEARRPAVVALLREYADLRDLIEADILIPLSAPLTDRPSVRPLPEETLELIRKEVADSENDWFPVAVQLILEEQRRRERLSEEIDFFFPSEKFSQVLGALLRAAEHGFASKDIRSPFKVANLVSLPAINPDVLSTEDLVNMRENEELFAEWRALIGRVFARLHDRRGEYSNIEMEFRDAVDEELVEWKARVREEQRRSSVVSKVLGGGRDVTVGMAAGALTGGLTTGPAGSAIGAAVGGALGSAVQPLIELILSLMSGGATAEHRAMLNHYVAIGGSVE